jgi:hypothetical protein
MTLLTTAEERLRECNPTTCPVCGESHCVDGDEFPMGPTGYDPDEIHRAAHCCLWKTHDHAARVRIADRVEAGQDWATAIAGETS